MWRTARFNAFKRAGPLPDHDCPCYGNNTCEFQRPLDGLARSRRFSCGDGIIDMNTFQRPLDGLARSRKSFQVCAEDGQSLFQRPFDGLILCRLIRKDKPTAARCFNAL